MSVAVSDILSCLKKCAFFSKNLQKTRVFNLHTRRRLWYTSCMLFLVLKKMRLIIPQFNRAPLP